MRPIAPGGAAGAVFNAAKEVALDHFIARNIGFLDMAAVVEATLDAYAARAPIGEVPRSLEAVLTVDAEARALAGTAAAQRAAMRG